MASIKYHYKTSKRSEDMTELFLQLGMTHFGLGLVITEDSLQPGQIAAEWIGEHAERAQSVLDGEVLCH